MKILSHNPATVTVDKDGKVLVYNIDELRRNAIRDPEVMRVFEAYVKFRIDNRK